MIIDAPAVDWLTFTTYENDHYLGWKDWQRKLSGSKKQGKFACMTGNGEEVPLLGKVAKDLGLMAL